MPVVDAAHTLPVGELVGGRYRIESVLGIGGFGVTYKALDLHTNEPVAVKERVVPGSRRDGNGRVAATQSGDGQDVVRHFLQEAEVLRRVRHPNIVRIVDFFGEGATAFLVMEYLHGETVEMNVFAHGAWDEASTIALVQGVGAALQAVHAFNFLHRDVKPANVMLVAGRGPVLIDFGSSRESVTAPNAALTQIVTPGYAAPEQYGSRGRVGSYTDIYALGSIVYFVLMGEAPPPATDRLAHDEMVKLTRRFPRFVSTVATAADTSLRLRADDRQQTVAEFFDDAGMGDGSLNPALNNHVTDVASHPSASTVQTPVSAGAATVPPSLAATSSSASNNTAIPQSLASSAATPVHTAPAALSKPRQRRSGRRIGAVVGGVGIIAVLAAFAPRVFNSSADGSKRTAKAKLSTQATSRKAPLTTLRASTTTKPVPTTPTSGVSAELEVVPVTTAVLAPGVANGAAARFADPSARSDAFVGLVYRSNASSSLSQSEALKLMVEHRRAVRGGPAVRSCDLRALESDSCLAAWLKRPGLIGVIGMTKNDDVDAFAELGRAGVPLLAIGPQRETLTSQRVSPSFFRLTPSVSQIGTRAAEAAKTEERTKVLILDGLAAKTTEGDKNLRAVYEPARLAFEAVPGLETTRRPDVEDPDLYNALVTFGMDETEINSAIKSLGGTWTGSLFMAGVDLSRLRGCGTNVRCESIDSGFETIPQTVTTGTSRKPVAGSWAAAGSDAYDMLIDSLPTVWPATLGEVHSATTANIQDNTHVGLVSRYRFDATGANQFASAIVLRRRSTGATCIVTQSGCV